LEGLLAEQQGSPVRNISAIALQCAQYAIEANFYVSLLMMSVGSLLSLTENYSIFEFNVDLYGELANNLRSIMAYLALTEIMVFLFCFLTKQYQHFIFVGFFLIVMIGSVQFYGEINSIDLCLLYAGLSHILFGTLAVYKNKRILESPK
jgi:hypothetical protein